MSGRQAIQISGFTHRNPVPAASRIGPHVYSGVLAGRDPVTHQTPETLDEQVVLLFDRFRELMEAVGGSMDDIIKITFWVLDYRDRAAINREWERAFPDPQSRPARQVMAAYLDEGTLVHADLVAILPERRVDGGGA
jgi:enamine deaminase RidA (YjgF/YER057c/UK114 family)